MSGEKKNKRSYLNDFARNINGDYEYIGSHYIWVSPTPRSRHLVKLWALAGLSSVLILVSGILPAEGIKTAFYIIIPYILEFCAAVSLIWSLCKMTQGGGILREYTYNSSVKKINSRNYIVCINAVLAAITELVYIILHLKNTTIGMDICIIVLQLVVFILSMFFHRHFDEIQWQKK